MRRAMLCLMFAALLALTAQAAFAASSINVTVTLQQVGVDVNPTSWALGNMGTSAVKTSWVSTVAGYFTATNAGNVAEDFTITTGPTSPSNWAADTSAGVDAYVIGFGIGVNPYTSEPTYTTFTGTVALASDVAASGTAKFDLKFQAPATGSTYNAAGESFTVSLGASAH